MLYLVRHGREKYVKGETETRLSDEGKEQVSRLGVWLRKKLQGRNVVVYCSKARRTQETARLLGFESSLSSPIADDEYDRGKGMVAGFINENLGNGEDLVVVTHSPVIQEVVEEFERGTVEVPYIWVWLCQEDHISRIERF